MAATSLKDARAALLADTDAAGCGVRPRPGGRLDAALAEVFADAAAGNIRVALVALGSYGRRELCPGSDVDVLLLHDVRGRQRATRSSDLAERCWYPLWDAGFVTGHGLRTVKESLALADEDLDALTSFLDVRTVAGDATLTDELDREGSPARARGAARACCTQLADAAELRRLRPGLVVGDARARREGRRRRAARPAGVGRGPAARSVRPEAFAGARDARFRVDADASRLADAARPAARRPRRAAPRRPADAPIGSRCRSNPRSPTLLGLADADALDARARRRSGATSRGSRATCGCGSATTSPGPSGRAARRDHRPRRGRRAARGPCRRHRRPPVSGVARARGGRRRGRGRRAVRPGVAGPAARR